MPIYKITPSEMKECCVANLPTRPSFPSLYAGQVLSASELRAAFDALPLLIADALNGFVDSLGLFAEKGASESLASLLATRLFEGHSLEDLFADIQNGSLATYLSADGTRPLAEVLEALQNEVDALKLLRVETVGEGDCIYAAAIEDGNRLVLYKKALGEELTQALHDTVSERVEPLSRRIRTLEQAAQDTVYYYDYAEHVGATITPPELAVGGAMVSAIYNKTPPVRGENLLPEAALPAFFPERENLSLVYDAASQALVLNGTLSANESVDVPFVFPITQFAYSFKVFSLDGTVDAVGDSPTLSLRASDGSLFSPLSLETGKTTGYVTSAVDLIGKNVEAVRLSAATDTVFTNYRFQLAFQVGDTDATHAACSLDPKLRTPHTFALRSKNLWKSGTKASGTTAVTLTVDDPLPAGKYVLSFRRVAEGPPSRFFFQTLYADGSVKSTTVAAVTGERSTCVLSPTAPFVGFSVFAARTAALSEGVPIFVDEIMLEDENGQGVFYPYHEDVLLPIPQSVRSLPAYGVTLDTENYNYVDFSLGIYTDNIKALSLCGEEAWEETDEAGVFALPVDTEEEPETLSTTGLFFAEMEQRTPFSIWFEDGHIKLCCPHLTSKEALCDLLATVPFCVYLVLPCDEYSIPPAIVQSGDDVIFLPFEEGDTAWVLDEDGEPVTTAAITLLHQLKL